MSKPKRPQLDTSTIHNDFEIVIMMITEIPIPYSKGHCGRFS